MRFYALVNPQDGKYFYVGRTENSLRTRLVRHKIQSKTRNSSKDKKIKKIIDNGFEPKIIELAKIENPTPEDIVKTEQAWIDWLSFNHPLTNKAPASGGVITPETSIIKWSEEILNRLGKEPDVDIAKDLKCSRSAVSAKRRKLGIKSYDFQKWTEGNIALLGTMPDFKLAKRMKVSSACISKRRRILNIKPFSRDNYPVHNKYIWTKDNIKILGTDTDKNVAKQLKICSTLVARKRKELKIPAYKSPNVGKRPLQKNKLSNEVINLLGVVSDLKLAELAKTSADHIAKERKKRGIKNILVQRDERNQEKLKEIKLLLGTDYDRVIAQKIGYSRSHTAKLRRKYNIPKFSENEFNSD